MVVVRADALVQALSPAALQHELQQFREISLVKENEHSWERIEKGLQRFSNALKSSACGSLAEELVKTFREKDIINFMVASLATERTRLSGSALGVMTALCTLEQAYLPLFRIYVPEILRLLARANKIYIIRAQDSINTIIRQTHLTQILPFITEHFDDKSATVRKGCADAFLVALQPGGIEHSACGRKQWEEVESVIKRGSIDKDVKIREVCRKIWDTYRSIWPARAEEFIAPLTPTIRRYLNLQSGGLASSTSSATDKLGKSLLSSRTGPLAVSSANIQPLAPSTRPEPARSATMPTAARRAMTQSHAPVRAHTASQPLRAPAAPVRAPTATGLSSSAHGSNRRAQGQAERAQTAIGLTSPIRTMTTASRAQTSPPSRSRDVMQAAMRQATGKEQQERSTGFKPTRPVLRAGRAPLPASQVAPAQTAEPSAPMTAGRSVRVLPISASLAASTSVEAESDKATSPTVVRKPTSPGQASTAASSPVMSRGTSRELSVVPSPRPLGKPGQPVRAATAPTQAAPADKVPARARSIFAPTASSLAKAAEAKAKRAASQPTGFQANTKRVISAGSQATANRLAAVRAEKAASKKRDEELAEQRESQRIAEQERVALARQEEQRQRNADAAERAEARRREEQEAAAEAAKLKEEEEEQERMREVEDRLAAEQAREDEASTTQAEAETISPGLPQACFVDRDEELVQDIEPTLSTAKDVLITELETVEHEDELAEPDTEPAEAEPDLACLKDDADEAAFAEPDEHSIRGSPQELTFNADNDGVAPGLQIEQDLPSSPAATNDDDVQNVSMTVGASMRPTDVPEVDVIDGTVTVEPDTAAAADAAAALLQTATLQAEESLDEELSIDSAIDHAATGAVSSPSPANELPTPTEVDAPQDESADHDLDDSLISAEDEEGGGGRLLDETNVHGCFADVQDLTAIDNDEEEVSMTATSDSVAYSPYFHGLRARIAAESEAQAGLQCDTSLAQSLPSRGLPSPPMTTAALHPVSTVVQLATPRHNHVLSSKTPMSEMSRVARSFSSLKVATPMPLDKASLRNPFTDLQNHQFWPDSRFAEDEEL